MIDKVNISATELPQSLNKVAKNKICFRGNDDNKLERTPQNDTVQLSNKKNHTVKNVTLGATTPDSMMQTKESIAVAVPDLKPTGTPIIKYTTKDGEKMMAREVILGNGYKCMAVSNEKNPNEATLMNKEEFKKFFIESVEQKESKSNKEVKVASGHFADKNFEVECKQGLSNRSLSGKVDDLNFNIKHNGKVFKADEITGNIGDKPLNIKMSDSVAKLNLKGTLGNEPIDLKVSRTFSGYNLKGQFKDKKLDIDLERKWNSFAIKSDKMDLRVKNKSMFGNDVKVKGTYNEDKDLIPLLMDMAYSLNDEELELLTLVMLL